MRIAVFASGNGSNFEAIHSAGIPVEVVITDQLGAGVLQRAARLSVPALVVAPGDFGSRMDFERALVLLLAEQKIDLIALAGYMRIVGPTLLSEYAGRIINIHPSLLPAFPGKSAITDAHTAGVRETGVTIHYIDQGIDTGPIIAQRSVAIDPGMTLPDLEGRIHSVEHQLYPQILRQLTQGA